MSIKEKCKVEEREKRSYFRIDDLIPIVVSPVSKDKFQDISRVLSISDVLNLPLTDMPDSLEDQKLSNMITAINTKLDFIISYFLLDKEGLLSGEKKRVNISASGIRFTVTYPVKVKDIMEIKLLLPTYPPTAVFTYGEVTRVRHLDDKTYEIALQYLNVGDKARDEIIQYMLTRQRETIKTSKDISIDE